MLMINTNDGEFWHYIKNFDHKKFGTKRSVVQSSLQEKLIGM